MKKTLKHFPVIILLLLYYATSAQLKDVKWTAPETHPCFYGLSISVLNMGYQKDPNSHLWGIRITNKYRKTVTLRYKLIVGGEGQAGNGGVIWKLKPGDTWTDGGDVFTGNMFKTPANDWKAAIWQVCFDGINCGGPNECYADCDRINGNENQPCDAKDGEPVANKPPAEMNGTAPDPDGEKKDANGYSGKYDKWEQEGKDVVMTIGISETGIYWKEKEGQPPSFFKNIKPGVFRYDKGDDFMLVRFESDDRLSLWNNGSLVGYFKNPALAKKPEPKKEETVKTKPEENKPKPVTENKSISGDCKVTGKFLEKGQFYIETGKLYVYADNQVSNIHTITVGCQGQNLSVFIESSSGERIEKSIATAIPPVERPIVNNSKVLGTWKGRWHYQIKTYADDNINGTSPYGLEVIFQLLENGNIVIAPPYDIANPRNGQVGYILFTKIR